MNITCNIIRDLLPLYVEDMMSEDSGKLIEEHLCTCEGCKKYLEELSACPDNPADFEILPMKKMKSLLFQKKLRSVIISVFIALAAVIICIGNLAAPKYYPYSDGPVTLIVDENGIICAAFDEKASGYAVSSTLSDDQTGLVYHLVAWDSIWSRHILKSGTGNTVLNPDGKKVSAVYYYEADGSGEILLYGEQQNPSGVIIRQPKLALYAAAAVVLALICAAALLLFRKKRRPAAAMAAVLLLPVSYLLGHLLVMGFSFATYSATHDFYRILLAAVPCFLILLTLRKTLALKMCGRQI